MFELTVSWWSLVARVTIAYLALLVLVRLTGKRTMSGLAPMDLLTMLLVSETLSPSLTAGDDSSTGGLIAAGTLFLLTLLVTVVTFRFTGLERVVEGTPAILVRDGKVDEGTLRRERITVQELNTALRLNGIRRLSDVHLAVVEPDGRITFLQNGRPGADRF